jgi:hypothetical protein
MRKTCTCCGKIYDLESYRELPICTNKGKEVSFDEHPQRLEMRNCSCGSTIGIWTDRDGIPYANQEDNK